MMGKYQKYHILGQTYDILTRGDWKRVVTTDFTNSHLNQAEVPNIKLSDDVINALLTNDHEYSIWCTVDQWQIPFNQWAEWPHNMYVHNSIERWDSQAPSEKIKNSNLLSTSLNTPPVATDNTGDGGYTFGFAGGDTYYSYGCPDRNGLVQHFSGPGRGSIYVR